MIGGINLQGSGKAEIDGIIEQYKVKAGENINAGDFVKFINNNPSKTVQLNDNVTSKLIAIQLNSGKVIIEYIYFSGSNYHIFLIICSVTSSNIKVLTNTFIVNTDNNESSMYALNESTIIIFFKYTTTYNDSYIVKCTINDSNEVSVTSPQQFRTYSVGYMVQITTSLIVVFTYYSQKYFMQAFIIGSSSITVATPLEITSIESFSYYNRYNFGSKISSTRFFIGQANKVLFFTITSSGEVKFDTSTTITNSARAPIKFVALSSTKFLGVSNDLTIRIYTLSSNTMNASRTLKFTSNTETLVNNNNISIIDLSNNNFCIVIKNIYDNTDVFISVCSVDSEDNIIIKSDYKLPKVIYLHAIGIKADSNNIWLLYGDDNQYNYLKAGLISIIPSIAKVEKVSDEIIGIAKDSGSDGQNIDVYIPRRSS